MESIKSHVIDYNALPISDTAIIETLSRLDQEQDGFLSIEQIDAGRDGYLDRSPFSRLNLKQFESLEAILAQAGIISFVTQYIGEDPDFKSKYQDEFGLAGVPVKEETFRLVEGFMREHRVTLTGKSITREALLAFFDANFDGQIQTNDLYMLSPQFDHDSLPPTIDGGYHKNDAKHVATSGKRFLHDAWIIGILTQVLFGKVQTEPPQILRDFLAQSDSGTFVTEDSYISFYFNTTEDALESDNGIFTTTALYDQVELTQAILSANATATIHFFVPDDILAQRVRQALRFNIPVMQRNRVRIEIDPSVKTEWAQDLGEPAGGEHAVYVRGWLMGDGLKSSYDGRYATPTPDRFDLQLYEIPACFQGGNLTKAVCGETDFVVIGDSDIRETKRQYMWRYGYEISTEEILEIFKIAFHAEAVVVLANADAEFHIDQMVFFPEDGVAVMPTVIPSDNADLLYQQAVAENKRRLMAQGFRVIEIPMTDQNVRAFQDYTNTVVIADDAQRRLIMPDFGNTDIQAQIQQILENNGYKVTWVASHTQDSKGSLHCLTGAFY